MQSRVNIRGLSCMDGHASKSHQNGPGSIDGGHPYLGIKKERSEHLASCAQVIHRCSIGNASFCGTNKGLSTGCG